MRKKLNNFFAGLFICFIALSSPVAAAQPNHDYPRTAILVWKGVSPAYWAMFDLCMMWKDDNLAQKIKAIDPSTIILPTNDWNCGGPFRGNLPSAWGLRDHQGETVGCYPALHNQPQADPTSQCGSSGGKKFNQGVADELGKLDFSIYDGVASDGAFSFVPDTHAPNGEVDLNRNGVEDSKDIMSGVIPTAGWRSSQWSEGWETLVKNIKEKMPAQKIVFTNPGGPQGWGRGLSNGHLAEKWLKYSGSWSGWWNDYANWEAANKAANVPLVMWLNNSGEIDDSMNTYGQVTGNSIRYWRLMRFGLASALLGDMYYNYEKNDVEYAEHIWSHRYDEYEAPLGFPKGDRQRISSGVYCRFYDNGVAIVSSKRVDVSVTDAQLQALPGYQGPYYRLKGAQDPKHNNGSLFQSIKLSGGTGWNGVSIGDGIILLREKRDVLAPVIVDHHWLSTTPGYASVSRGSWTEGSYTDDSWVEVFNLNSGVKGHLYTNSSGKSATFQPGIVVAGEYEIYEWHPSGGASSVPYTINYDGGTKSGTINQSSNSGKWNSLGKYKLNSSSKVVITSGSGKTYADAIKFVLPVKPITSTVKNLYQDDLSKELLGISAQPNPFNPSTTIHFIVPHSQPVSLAIYDTRGDLIKQLKQGLSVGGSYQVRWDGKDNAGRLVGSRIYVYQLKLSAQVFSGSLILLK